MSAPAVVPGVGAFRGLHGQKHAHAFRVATLTDRSLALVSLCGKRSMRRELRDAVQSDEQCRVCADALKRAATRAAQERDATEERLGAGG